MYSARQGLRNSMYFPRLSSVNLDRAVDNNLMLGEPALGIEQCECPSQYSGLSCQVKLYSK